MSIRKTYRSSNLYFTKVMPYLDDIGTWRMKGMSYEEVADKLGIPLRSFKRYVKEFDELYEVVSLRSRSRILNKAEESLVNLATGYVQEATTTYYRYDKRTGKKYVDSEVVRQSIVKPNSTALRFLLTNIDGDNWKVKYNQPEPEKASPGLDNFISFSEQINANLEDDNSEDENVKE